jgi:hypothetical protein
MGHSGIVRHQMHPRLRLPLQFLLSSHALGKTTSLMRWTKILTLLTSFLSPVPSQLLPRLQLRNCRPIPHRPALQLLFVLSKLLPRRQATQVVLSQTIIRQRLPTPGSRLTSMYPPLLKFTLALADFPSVGQRRKTLLQQVAAPLLQSGRLHLQQRSLLNRLTALPVPARQRNNVV